MLESIVETILIIFRGLSNFKLIVLITVNESSNIVRLYFPTSKRMIIF